MGGSKLYLEVKKINYIWKHIKFFFYHWTYGFLKFLNTPRFLFLILYNVQVDHVRMFFSKHYNWIYFLFIIFIRIKIVWAFGLVV